MIINDDSFYKLWNTTMDRRNLLGAQTPFSGGEYYYLSGVLNTCQYLFENKVGENEEGNT